MLLVASYVRRICDMPLRIATPCSYPRCRRVSSKRYCDEHGRVSEAEDRKERGTSAQRGYDARHRRWRSMVLARCPICKMCGEALATVADHIIPLDPRSPSYGDWSLENGQGLCHRCHTIKTKNEGSLYETK
jgi:5-methylcytosine-specific restriction protein A